MSIAPPGVWQEHVRKVGAGRVVAVFAAVVLHIVALRTLQAPSLSRVVPRQGREPMLLVDVKMAKAAAAAAIAPVPGTPPPPARAIARPPPSAAPSTVRRRALEIPAAAARVPLSTAPAAKAEASVQDAEAPPLRLDAAVIGRAVREAAAASSLVPPGVLPADRPSGRTGGTASGFVAAARGDCLKGEFEGRDMGLLSLPMLALAAAQGRCAPP